MSITALGKKFAEVRDKMRDEDAKQADKRKAIIHTLMRAAATERDLTAKEADQLFELANDLGMNWQEVGLLSSKIKQALGYTYNASQYQQYADNYTVYGRMTAVLEDCYKEELSAAKRAYHYWNGKRSVAAGAKAELEKLRRAMPELFEEDGTLKYTISVKPQQHPAPLAELYKNRRKLFGGDAAHASPKQKTEFASLNRKAWKLISDARALFKV